MKVQAADTSNQPPVFPDKDPSTDGVQNEQMEISVPEDTAPGAAIGAPVKADLTRTVAQAVRAKY